MTENPQGPGTELRTTREAMGVSVREVADALNLPAHVIEALEADDYERLPPSVFTRGYLRSYARLLELAPDSLLARYPEVTEEVDAVTGQMPAVSMPARPSLVALLVGAFAAVLLVLFLIWWFAGNEDGSGAPAEQTPASGQETSVPIARPVPDADRMPATGVMEEAQDPERGPDQMGVTEEAVEPDASVESTEASPVDAGAFSEGIEEAPAATAEAAVSIGEPEFEPEPPASAEDEVPAVREPVVPSRQERRITEFGDDVVTLTFSEDCWVEVKTVDGENLYSDLNRAGRTLVLTGRAPFRVLLGYAPGVSLSYNGEPVPLERHTRNNVASLVVGAP